MLYYEKPKPRKAYEENVPKCSQVIQPEDAGTGITLIPTSEQVRLDKGDPRSEQEVSF